MKSLAVFNKAILTLTIFVATNFSHASENIGQKNVSDFLALSLEELLALKISIATGNETPIMQAPAIATVITAQQIEAMGATTLDEILETVPGVHIGLSGTNRLDSIYSIRGLHTSLNPHALLLLNGMPLNNSLQGGHPLLFRLSVNNIDRVEVIRGPGSAIYGADAFSGVINIITKSAKAMDPDEFGARTGSFGYREAWIQTGKQFDHWDLAFSLNYQHSDGDTGRTIDSDLQTTFDGIYGTSASLAPGALSTRYETLNSHLTLENDHWKFNFNAWVSEDTGNGAGGAQALDPSSADDYYLYNGNLEYKTSDWFNNWLNSIRFDHVYYEFNADLTILPPGSTVGIGADGNLDPGSPDSVTFTDGYIGQPSALMQDSRLAFVNVYEGIKKHTIRIAFGRRYQSIEAGEKKNFGPGVIVDPTISPVDGSLTDVSDTDHVYLEDSSRTVNFLSLQDEWMINEAWFLTTGVRYDNYSDFGDTTNPRIALVWQTTEEITSKLLYGSAFRAPNFGEIGLKNNPSIIGDSNLEPETIDTVELSFSYKPYSSLQSSISFFSYKSKGLIEYVFDPAAGGKKATNARDQEGYGFEWEANWEISNSWRVSGSYAWQQSEDSDTGEDIADAPGQQFTANSYWRVYPQWLLGAQVNWVADRKRAASDSRDPIDDYTLVDFTLKRQNLFKGLDVTLGVKNLFDKDAREPSDGTIPGDFPLEGRKNLARATP